MVIKTKQNKTKKQQVKRVRGNDMKKEFMVQCVRHMALKIVEARDDGQTPHGIAKKLLLEGQECFPEMNMNMINYAIKKLNDEKPENSPKLGTVITSGGRSSISSITDDIMGATSTKEKQISISDDIMGAK